VIAATSGPEALKIFYSQHVDLVVLDYWMACMNGVAVGRELKRLNPATPIVIYSNYAELPCESIGSADAWISKTAGVEVLLTKLDDLLHRCSAP
jgi:CheY-like chemotaxis protein